MDFYYVMVMLSSQVTISQHEASSMIACNMNEDP